eukprot:CAMPEP_0194282538 /NCGR_PEP_ID=MMETSP0169-20130528/23352_1 /TAXON_ID=218684 /ORGANISM="Corethron pennatum, Strain L29A3" /LENGTH=161 /DNA_ID=CAMNT_0039027895 /DNA_START=83 /DNA_END=568 /DNA_ORIENTATION=-
MDTQRSNEIPSISESDIIVSAATILESSHEPMDLARRLLGRTVECTLGDGRVLVGVLQCIATGSDLILSDATERRSIHASHAASLGIDISEMPTLLDRGAEVVRHLSQAMVPGKHLIKVRVSKIVWDDIVKKEEGVGGVFDMKRLDPDFLIVGGAGGEVGA